MKEVLVHRIVAAAAVSASFVLPVSATKPFADSVQGIPVCRQKAPATPESWPRQTLGGTFSFALPACFERVPDDEPRYVHGGTRWKCGATTVEVVWGMWGLDSFGDGRERCTTKVAGRRVLVTHQPEEKGLSLIVWYPTGKVQEPIVSVWSPRAEDKDLVADIAFSGVVKRGE
jgi:hypothetical protein